MGIRLLFIPLFAILLTANILIAYKLYAQYQRIENSKKVLDEIAYIGKNYDQFAQSSAPLVMGTYETQTNVTDGRAANLKSFFRKYNSPLYDYADYIVKTSDKYQFDYRLLPAIAMQESGVCRVIPHNSYNCWGWGIYGNTITRFSSYEEAIDTVAAGLKKNYIDKGLITASAIMAKYTPSSNGSWAHGVNTFLKVIE
jgi:hypothetical protein